MAEAERSESLKFFADTWPLLRQYCPSGSQPKVELKEKRPVHSHRPLPLLGSNQDSPDPEGPP